MCENTINCILVYFDRPVYHRHRCYMFAKNNTLADTEYIYTLCSGQVTGRQICAKCFEMSHHMS